MADDSFHAPSLQINNCEIRIGTSAWTERSLTHETNWYPRRTMKASERIAFYIERFSLTEIETTYRFPPTPDLSRQWAERSSSEFRFDIQAWSLLTGAPTIPASLWEDLFQEIRPDRRDKNKLYLSHLSRDAIDECWRRFKHALEPLHAPDTETSGRLGTIIFRFPRWFTPKETSRQQLSELRQHMSDFPVAIQFSCPDWTSSTECETTFSLLEDLDFSFVCVDTAEKDARGLNRVYATTNDLAVVRLLGRRDVQTSEEWTPDRRGYRYNEDELTAVAGRLQHLSKGAKEMHVIASTCWQDDAVLNAQRLIDTLQATTQDLHLP